LSARTPSRGKADHERLVAKIQADRGSNLGREDFANRPGELQQCTAPKGVMDYRDGPLISEQAPAMKFCAAAREYNR